MPALLHFQKVTRSRRIALLCLFLSGVLGTGMCVTAASPTIRVEITGRYHNQSLNFDLVTMTNRASQPFSITRLDFLLSDFALHRTDGTWLGASNWQAYVNLGGNRSSFEITASPEGSYDRVRFHVGLTKELNHSKTEIYPADHPLNPALNNLHWTWNGSYIFMAIEGRWRTDRGELNGYAFHVGNDPQLMTVELPVKLVLDQNRTIELSLHADKIFDGNEAVQFTEEANSTHSRMGDAIATKLKANIEKAFSVNSVYATDFIATMAAPQRPVLISSNATLYRFTFSAPFPIPPLPRENPLTEEGVSLGRKLFNDPILSINNKQSCSSCHQRESGFTDAGNALSRGAEGQIGERNSMPLFNLAWKRFFFWDGRARSLHEQALMPIENPIEMHESVTNVVAKLIASKDYPALFEAAFGSKEINGDRVGRALEQFLLTLVSYDSKFDRALQGREQLTEEEQRGYELFFTEYDPRSRQFGADCFHCHGGPLFTNFRFSNNGLDATFKDLGVFNVTHNEFDRGQFSVPSLRNVEITGPYMHDGRFKTLEEVIEHYSSGVKYSDNLDPNLAKHPQGKLPLSEADKKALVAFLKTLTDVRFALSEYKATPGKEAKDASLHRPVPTPPVPRQN